MFNKITFYVSNSKQIATYFITQFGFELVDYQGLETGKRCTSTYTLKLNNILFNLKSCIIPYHNCSISNHVNVHGDSVRDISFSVKNCKDIYDKAISKGAQSISKPYEENGCIIATIKTLSKDITHTFIQGELIQHKDDYKYTNDINNFLPPVNLQSIDHIVTNTEDIEPVVQWYERILNFHRFWSVDETQIHTEYSALRSIVVTNKDESIKMPINEPAPGIKTSQITEFLNYHGGNGIQHIALSTNDIIKDIIALKQRGVEFLNIPSIYYENLKTRLQMSNKNIHEDIDILQSLCILVDFDENGYLLQIFTKPITSRPTLFIEIIQRYNFNGFGAGNFKALFESIEHEQSRRNNL